MKIAFFDLDHTLVDIDTTIKFVEFYLRRVSWKKFLLFWCLSEVGFMLDIRKKGISLLSGAKREDLEKAADEFFQRYHKHLNPAMIKLMLRLKEEGKKTFIVSGSLDFVAKRFAHDFDGYRGSTLDFSKDVCLGIFKQDILYRKKEILAEFENVDWTDSWCFSDNHTDEELLKSFGHPCAISHNVSDTSYWKRKNIPSMPLPRSIDFNPWLALLPFSYAIYTKRISQPYLKNFIAVISIIPLLIGFLVLGIPILNFVFYLLALISFHTFYEIGYVTNDAKAFNEKNPSLLATQKIRADLPFVVALKTISFILISSLLILFGFSLKLFYIFSLGALLVFSLHNLLREDSKMKCLTFPLLRMSRIVVPFAIFGSLIIYPISFFLVYEFFGSAIFWYGYKNINARQYSRLVTTSLPHLLAWVIILVFYILYHNFILSYLLITGAYFLFVDGLWKTQVWRQSIKKGVFATPAF